MKKHILSVLVKNSPGVVSRVSGLFSRRGFNIDSFIGQRTQNPEISRMTIAVIENDDVLEQVVNQLNKLEDVIKIVELKQENSVCREMVLIKVNADDEKRTAINEIVNIFRSKIIDVSANTMTIELTGDESKVNALIRLMEDYGIVEIVRTGICALERGENSIYN